MTSWLKNAGGKLVGVTKATVGITMGATRATMGATAEAAKAVVGMKNNNNAKRSVDIEATERLLTELEYALQSITKRDPRKSVSSKRKELISMWTQRLISSEERFVELQESSEEILVTFKELFLKTKLLQQLLKTVLEIPPEQEERDELVEFLDVCLMGEKEAKVGLIQAIIDLGKIMRGLEIEEQMIPLICEALAQLKRSPKVESLYQEALTGKSRSRTKKSELNLMPDMNEEAPNDEILKERISRSSQLLQGNVGTRALIDSALRMLGEAHTEDHFVHCMEAAKDIKSKLEEEGKKGEEQLENIALSQKQLEERRSTKEEALNQEESKKTSELDSLNLRKRQLEEELALVNSKITSATAGIQVIHRDRAALRLETEAQQQEYLQQINVENFKIQKANQNAAAVTEVMNFVQNVSQTCAEHNSALGSELSVWVAECEEEQLDLTEMHLRHHSSMLSLLQKTLDFCYSELETMRNRYNEMKNLGMGDIASDIPTSMVKIQDKYLEAIQRVRSIELDIENIKLTMTNDFSQNETVESNNSLQTRKDLIKNLIIGIEQQLTDLKTVMAQCDEGSHPMVLTPASPTPHPLSPTPAEPQQQQQQQQEEPQEEPQEPQEQ